MKSGTNESFKSANGKRAFGILTQEIFSLDAAIRWFALEEAGREPRWAYRDLITGELRGATTMTNAELVDPLLLMVAEGRDALYGSDALANPHRLRFVVLAYADLVQIIARLGRSAYISVAIDPSTDAYLLGAKLANLLEQHQNYVFAAVNADGKVRHFDAGETEESS